MPQDENNACGDGEFDDEHARLEKRKVADGFPKPVGQGLLFRPTDDDCNAVACVPGSGSLVDDFDLHDGNIAHVQSKLKSCDRCRPDFRTLGSAWHQNPLRNQAFRVSVCGAFCYVMEIAFRNL
ncbi:MAG: hypothetical protein LBT74_08265, partial [Acidobacteriota bacterium]|nr:hypothetical protein [Acidobacteriota bacterium]